MKGAGEVRGWVVKEAVVQEGVGKKELAEEEVMGELAKAQEKMAVVKGEEVGTGGEGIRVVLVKGAESIKGLGEEVRGVVLKKEVV